MSFATDWQQGRAMMRCPKCRRIVCSEHPQHTPRLSLVTSAQQSEKAQTLIQCGGCRAMLEVRRAPAA